MATEQKQILYSPVDIDDADFANLEAEKSDEQIALDAFRDEMRETEQYAKITVSRQPTESTGRPGQKKLTFLFEVGMDDYSYSQLCARLRDEYGTGTYRLQGRDDQNILRFNRGVSIEAPKTVETENGNAMSVPAILRELRQTQADNANMLANFMRGPGHNADPMDGMMKMATAFSGIFQAMGIQPQAPVAPKTLMEQMTEYKMMQELFSGGNGDGGNSGEANMFSLLTETVKSFGPAIGMAIAAGQTSGTIPAAGPILPILPNPAEVTSHEPEIEPLSKQAMEMKPQIDFLVAQAKAGAEPGAVANTIFPNIPETALDSIEVFLQQDNYLQICSGVNAEVLDLSNWFNAWCEKMLQLIGDKLDAMEADTSAPIEKGADEVTSHDVTSHDAALPPDQKTLTGEPDPAQDSPVSSHDVAGHVTDTPDIVPESKNGNGSNT